MNKNPLITADTTILTFPWNSYESIKDLDSTETVKQDFLNEFCRKMLFSRIVMELSKIPLAQCVADVKGIETPILNNGRVNGGAFLSYFKDEVYGKFPGLELTSAAALTFMAMIARESRSNMILGSQNKTPELCAAVPPILLAFKNQVPYSAWDIHPAVRPFLLGKDLAAAVSHKDAMNEAVEELNNLMSVKGMSYDAMMAVVTPAKTRCWMPKDIAASYQVIKPKTGQKEALATNYNSLDGFERSMILNLWFFTHDHENMVVNINDFDSRTRMWMPVEAKRDLDIQTDGIFAMLKDIKNPYVPLAVEEIFRKKKQLTKSKDSTESNPKDDIPW